MVIVGIDPGLKATGYGFLKFESGRVQVLEVGTINPKQKDLFQNRILKIYRLLGELFDQHRPQYIVLEKLYAHHKHPATASILGHARGVICLVCAERAVNLEEFSVKRIRQALTGNGNATKLQTRAVVAQMLKINEQKLTLDASDALALALGFVQMNRLKI